MRYEFRPLTWTGPETEPRQSSGVFKAKWSDTIAFLGDELHHLEAVEPVVIQVDVEEGQLRRDGMLRSGVQPRHPGVAISFESKFGPLRYATDAYDCLWTGAMPGWQANVRAIYLALVALRAVDRYGVTKRGEQYTGWRAIEPPKPTFATATEAAGWMYDYATNELHILHGTGNGWKDLYRAMARKMHPDQGAPRAEWDRLDEARRVLTEAGML